MQIMEYDVNFRGGPPPPPAVYSEEQRRNDDLSDEIAALAAKIQCADFRLLELIREFGKHEGWAQQGAKTFAHWLSWRIGLAPGAAREKVRVANALENLPLISEAFSKGEISYSKVRAVTRVATPTNEHELITIALGATAAQVERIVRAWRKVDLQEETKNANYQQEHASLTTHIDDDRMLVVRGRLPGEIGVVFQKALDAATDAIFKERPDCTFPRRRVEALKLMAESALEGGLDPGNSADRYQVVVHVDQRVLENPEQPGGQSALAGGIGVSAETSRRIACDASIVEMVHDAEGNVLDVGRKTRTISPALKRALDARDPTCVWPGRYSTYVQGHHIKFWSEGGETKLLNLCNLCHHHHHLVHDGGYRVELLANGKFRFTAPFGWVIPDVPEPATPSEKPLSERKLEGWEGKPKWGYVPVDMEYLIWASWTR